MEKILTICQQSPLFSQEVTLRKEASQQTFNVEWWDNILVPKETEDNEIVKTVDNMR